MKKASGFTMLELLIVIAILGVIAGIGVFNGRQALQTQQENAALNSIRQSIWQGATAAASRGVEIELLRNGNVLILRQQDNQREIRRTTLPSGVSTNLPEGRVLLFDPPGRINQASYDALPDKVTVYANGKTHQLTISIIGEVKAEVSQ